MATNVILFLHLPIKADWSSIPQVIPKHQVSRLGPFWTLVYLKDNWYHQQGTILLIIIIIINIRQIDPRAQLTLFFTNLKLSSSALALRIRSRIKTPHLQPQRQPNEVVRKKKRSHQYYLIYRFWKSLFS